MVGMISTVEELLASLREIMLDAASPSDRALRTQELMQQSGLGGDWVPDAFRQCTEDHYSVRSLHIDPQGDFTVCVMAWLPGQTTSIHDHVAWCVASVYQGTEIEECFALSDQPDGSRCLLPTGTTELQRGQAVLHWPTEGDIHRVTCGPGGPAISIHIYGTDISNAGTSIRDTFDEMKIIRV